MANTLQTVRNDIPEIHTVWLCVRQGDQTLTALVLRGCAKHGGKEASVGWMLLMSEVSGRVLGIVYFLSIKRWSRVTGRTDW